uniref:Uncharacterized protein n=1 Tax=viral metagenome TaxID=1070528 RepID=A0A6C0CEC9_9ZZZZ
MVTINTHFYNQGRARGSLKKKINKTKKRRRLGKTKKLKNKKRKGRSMKTKKLKISHRKRNMLGGDLIQIPAPRLPAKLLEISGKPANITEGLEDANSPFDFYLVCAYECIGNTRVPTIKFCVVKEMVVKNGTLESIKGTSAAMVPGAVRSSTTSIITYLYDQMQKGKEKEQIQDIKDINGVMLRYFIDPPPYGSGGGGTIINIS